MTEHEVTGGAASPPPLEGPSYSPWDGGWALPPSGPGYWPPHYAFDPSPPPRRRTPLWRLVAALCVLALLAGGVATAVVVLTHGLIAAGPGGDAGIVDINTTLSGGGGAAGTGMVLTSSGEVLTNNHVVEGALTVNVQVVTTGTTYDAQVLGVDPVDDVALLRLQGASGLATVPTGDSSQAHVGDQVTAVGNALGRGGAPQAAQGSITALGQTITAADESGANQETLSGMIQINAAIQPGDSGGPLFNSSGRVIGMDTAAGGGRHWRLSGAEVAFAIPINSALGIAHQIASGSSSGTIQPGQGALLGVDVQSSTSPPGALVIDVVPGTPAAATSLAPGDVITSVGGSTVNSVSALRAAIARHHPGDNVVVVWSTGSGQQQASVTLAAAAPA